MSILSVATSGRSLSRTEVSLGLALAMASSRSRAATNSSRLMPLRFCNCIVKPELSPSPRTAPGTSAKTCASRRPAQRLAGALGDGVGGVFLAFAIVPMRQVDEALAGILPDRAAAAAAGDDEQRLDIRLFLRQQIFLDRVAHFERPRLRGARGQAELDLDTPLILAGQEAAGQAQEQDGQHGQG